MYTDTRHDFLSSFIADIIDNWNDAVVKVAAFFFVIVIDIFYHYCLLSFLVSRGRSPPS